MFRKPPTYILAGLPVGVFFFLVLRHIELPGLYYDEINPEASVVALLRHLQVGGDYDWPLISTYYIGMLSVYLGAPLHAFWGLSVTTVRLHHALYGAAILLLGFAYVYRANHNWWVAILGMSALAVDAGFILSFRTQYYINLVPMFLLLATLLLLNAYLDKARDRRTDLLILVAAGVCYGLSCWGHFIYWFYAPALLALAFMFRSRLRMVQLFAFGIGGVIGYSPWLFAMFRIWNNSPTTAAFIATFKGNVTTLVVTESSLLHRFISILERVRDTLSNANQPVAITGNLNVAVATSLKFWFLTSACALGCICLAFWATVRERQRAYFLLACFLSFAIVGSLAGDRLSDHHVNINMPLIYVFIALSFGIWSRTPIPRQVGAAVPAIFLIGLIAISLVQQAALFRELDRTGGTGAVSEMRTFIPYDLLSNYRQSVVFFPDWGFNLQATYLTNDRIALGSHPEPRPEALREALCSGKDAVIVLEVEHRSAAESAAQAIGTTVTRWRTYYQRDGKPNAELAIIEHRQVDQDVCVP